jgi:heat shock protein HtpX
MMRVLLLVLTNLAIMLVLGIVLTLTGLDAGGTMGALAVAFVFGLGGAFISLAISKWMARWSTGARVIAQPADETEQWLVDTVRRQAQTAGIGMPDVAIYEAAEVNAFATGINRNHALVAVSRGLLKAMSRDEAEAVLGHEISHVVNGDMITLTLIQGVLNTFVIFISRLLGAMIGSAINNASESAGEALGNVVYFIVRIVLEILLSIVASIIVMWFSRWREFRADAGGAQLAGRDKMIAALRRLQAMHEPSRLPAQISAFGINGGGGFMRLFMSHPPLDERIRALEAGR